MLAPKSKMFKIVINGLEYNIIKKLVNQIKSLMMGKEYIRKGRKKRVAYVDYIDSVEID